MADNVVANPGSGGSTFATDNKGGTEHWPISKMGWGTRDTNYNLVDLTTGLPVQPGTATIWPVSTSANASGGVTPFYNSALSTTVVAVKASAGNLYGFSFYNPNTATAFVQLFDLATGSVTLGTTVPNLSFPVPAQGVYDFNFDNEGKISFLNAISIAATTTATGLTALTTGLNANAFYK